MKRSARGVPLDEGWYQRLRAMPALIIPLTHNALNDLAIRGAALDMRAFRSTTYALRYGHQPIAPYNA